MSYALGGRHGVNDKAVQALAKVLADAKRGEVALVAVIAIDNDGKPNVLLGGEIELAPSVNLGADMLKATIMQQILARPREGVLRPDQAAAAAKGN